MTDQGRSLPLLWETVHEEGRPGRTPMSRSRKPGDAVRAPEPSRRLALPAPGFFRLRKGLPEAERSEPLGSRKVPSTPPVGDGMAGTTDFRSLPDLAAIPSLPVRRGQNARANTLLKPRMLPGVRRPGALCVPICGAGGLEPAAGRSLPRPAAGGRFTAG